jgi:AraC-like DNA-binding protein
VQDYLESAVKFLLRPRQRGSLYWITGSGQYRLKWLTFSPALTYLLHSSLELNETAYLLGYEDANSFFRAFHEWEGTSPGQWRTLHVASA